MAATGVRVDKPLAGDWHTWRVEWDGFAVRYFVDGAPGLGANGPAVTGMTNGVPQDRFAGAINDHPWQIVIDSNTPANGGWAPAIDDSQPFHERHDLYDYVRFAPLTQKSVHATRGHRRRRGRPA